MNATKISGIVAAVSGAALLILGLVAGASTMGTQFMGGGMGLGMSGPGHQGPGAHAGAHMGMAAVQSEFDYLTNMIPHHEEAIASARVLLEGTERAEMKTFAQSIIDTQTAEVAQMREWLATWYPGQDPDVGYEPMMRDLTRLTGPSLDRAFLEDMITHHMAAVMMSQQLVSQGLAEHPEVVPFAEGIRDAQHAEIFQMATWLRGR
jgi:uncharacterized protein (DUF305 family)